jgi:hypothetical protein
VATELATNLLKHAGSGELVISRYADSGGRGIELLALDKGPGISNVADALIDGHSTAGTPGSGLGAIRRNADLFSINSLVGKGTAVLARLGEAARPGLAFESAAINCPYPDEIVCGDGSVLRVFGHRIVVMMVDGSGHGVRAHEAMRTAVDTLMAQPPRPAEQLGEAVHRALTPTRGAAIAVTDIDLTMGRVAFCGIGNISAAVVEAGKVRRMISQNGTAGHIAPRIRSFDYPFATDPTIILHSDGISSRWDLADYPGLMVAHPALIAGVLYRDHRRGRDDAGIVAVRGMLRG